MTMFKEFAMVAVLAAGSVSGSQMHQRDIPSSDLASLASAASITATGPAALSSLAAFVSLDSVVFNPEPSLLTLLASAIPSTVQASITADPDAYLAFVEQLGVGTSVPDWLASQSVSVQSAVKSYYSVEVVEINSLAGEASYLGIGNVAPLNSYAAQTPTVTTTTTGGSGSVTATSSGPVATYSSGAARLMMRSAVAPSITLVALLLSWLLSTLVV